MRGGRRRGLGGPGAGGRCGARGQPGSRLQRRARRGLALDGVQLQAAARKVVLVDFWGTFCTPCKSSFPKLQALNAKYAGSGLKIVGISEDESGGFKGKIPAFASTYGAHFAIAWDEDLIDLAALSARDDAVVVSHRQEGNRPLRARRLSRRRRSADRKGDPGPPGSVRPGRCRGRQETGGIAKRMALRMGIPRNVTVSSSGRLACVLVGAALASTAAGVSRAEDSSRHDARAFRGPATFESASARPCCSGTPGRTAPREALEAALGDGHPAAPCRGSPWRARWGRWETPPRSPPISAGSHRTRLRA